MENAVIKSYYLIKTKEMNECKDGYCIRRWIYNVCWTEMILIEELKNKN